jgi:hypothetical protein
VHESSAAFNEAASRRVNEAIRRGAWPGEGSGAFRCECARQGCTELIELSPGEYEQVRSHGRRFIVSPGHEDPLVETIVERHTDYLVVQKRGEAGAVAEATDPRG